MDRSTDPQTQHERTERPTDADVAASDRAAPTKDDRGSGVMWSGIAVVAVIAVLVIVAFQNTQDVTFDFLWLDTSIPLILILAITFGIAVVVTESIGFVWRRRRRRRRRDRDELDRLRRRDR